MIQQKAVKNKHSPVFRGLFHDEFTAGFSCRADGNMSLNYADTADSLSNRGNFLNGLGLDPLALVCAKQTHSVNVRRAGPEDSGRGALAYGTAIDDTDALITNSRNLPIAIFTADCLSVFLYDPSSRSIGLAHAGWKGTAGHIVEKTVLAMCREFNARPDKICAAFGPAIRSCCYKVGREFEADFSGDLMRRGKELFLDLAGANRRQLAACGIKLINILDCGICTCCNNREYFSFRRENSKSARIMSVMALL